jgi:hypothetical protein
MIRRSILPLLALALAVPFVAKADTINFANYFPNQVGSADGVTFTLAGGDGPGGTPCACSFGAAALGNSPTGNYPTSEQLIFTFSGPVSGVSFVYDNFGNTPPGYPFAGGSFFDAFDGLTFVSTGFIGDVGAPAGSVSVPGTITSLVLDNNSGGLENWQFGVYSLTFNSGATPEPASIVTLGTGLLGLAGSLYRRRRATR